MLNFSMCGCPYNMPHQSGKHTWCMKVFFCSINIMIIYKSPIFLFQQGCQISNIDVLLLGLFMCSGPFECVIRGWWSCVLFFGYSINKKDVIHLGFLYIKRISFLQHWCAWSDTFYAHSGLCVIRYHWSSKGIPLKMKWCHWCKTINVFLPNIFLAMVLG
jgi:hypothetical protein